MQKWVKLKIGDIFDTIRGSGLSKDSIDQNGKYECILYGELFTKYKEIIKQVVSKTNIDKGVNSISGDLLLPGSTTTNAKDLAICSVVNKDNVKLGGDINILRNKNTYDIDPNYIAYYLTNMKKREISAKAQGTTIVHLYAKDLKDIEIELPTIEEQRRIAKILLNVDCIIDKINEDIKNIQTEKQILMKNIFNYGIYHEKLKTTNIGQIPENWKVKKFQELIDSKDILDIMDGNHGELHPTAKDYVSNGIPFIMANNIVDGKLNLENCKYISKERAEMLRKGFAKENDVLITHKGSVGNVAIVKNITTPYIMLTPQVTYYRINEQSKILTKEYLYYFFQSPNFQNRLKILSAQSTRAYIGITAQRQLEIVIPKIEEQNKIVEILSKLDNKLILLKKKNKEYQNLKKGLMQQLLTGKVRVKI